MNKIILFFTLISVFTGIDAANLKEFKYEYNIAAGFIAAKLPFCISVGLKKSVSRHHSDNILVKRFKDAAERGSMYWYLRSQQDYKYFDGEKQPQSQLPMLNTTKENIDSMAQQAGYIAGDILISEVADRVAQLKPIKDVIESKPIQCVSNNISEENKKFFKDQAIFAVSAAFVNGAYQLSEKGQAFMSIHNRMYSDRREDQGYIAKEFAFDKCKDFVSEGPNFNKDFARFYDATLYNRGGAVKAITEVLTINSLDHFVVKKYISEDMKEASPLVSWGLCRYIVFPVIESLLKK